MQKNRGFRKYKSCPTTYCGNCGKYGHSFKSCGEPVTSYGVILIKVDDDLIKPIISHFKYEPDKEKDKLDMVAIDKETNGIKFENNDDMENFCKHKDNIKFLMIRRKHTYGYIEFIRGKYSIDHVDGIIFLFRQMTPEEIKKISNNTFDNLWEDLWANGKTKSNYQQEFNNSKNKFDKLKNEKEFPNLEFYIDNVQPNYRYAEWGFPKGRRGYQESDRDCGIREFKEESGFNDNEFVILDKIKPIGEIFVGTNGVNYRHIYYLAITLTDKEPTINQNSKHQANEIGAINWFTYDDAIGIIRDHHTEKRKVLTEVYMYFINSINKITNN